MDVCRMAVVWQISLMFIALLGGDIREFKSYVDDFQAALQACELHCADYRQSWVIKTF